MRTAVSDPPERAPIEPAEGRPDMDLPGAAGPGASRDPDAELPQRLADRIDDEAGGIAPGEPDLLPDVEVPDGQM
ncbi:MAG TPA: hypothetical protein VE011_10300 [Candidatus Dormibacteraeota bacterium]|nr:hypothetical protein [Candidatus Dormibacteraeota bacterium]